MKRLLLTIICTMACIVLRAQELAPQAKSFREDPFNHPQFPLFIVVMLGAVVLILVFVVFAYAVRVIRLLKTNTAPAVTSDESSTTEVQIKKTVFEAYKWHLYGSGALLVIIITIVVSSEIVTGSDAPATTQMATTKASQQPEQSRPEKKASDANTDAATIERGSQVFQANCAACHRNDGGGTAVGPNLTDEFWLHGGDTKSIYSTIQHGVTDKGMPAWASILSPDNLKDVAAFISSIQGTNPPGAKAPQGEKFAQTATAE